MQKRAFRKLMPAVLAPILAIASLGSALAQSYPDKPVKLVVPFAAGGPADALGRILGEKLTQRWGQPVVIENRGGAGGNIGAAVVARAAPDGYTLLLNASNHVINASLMREPPLRRHQGLHADLRARLLHAGAGRASLAAGEHAQGIRRAGAHARRTGSPSPMPAAARPRISRQSCSRRPPASPSRICPIAARRRQPTISWPGMCTRCSTIP